jgi:ribose 5-phosphate isomerase B
MKVAVGSDERTPLVDTVVQDLRGRGHEVILVGPPAGEDIEWAEVGRRLGGLVATGGVETGVLFCWTGTGASIAANKVRGIRAALCTDATTAEGARKYNDANVLVMSLRLTSPTIASEMLDVWFATKPDPSQRDNIALVEMARQKDREQVARLPSRN